MKPRPEKLTAEELMLLSRTRRWCMDGTAASLRAKALLSQGEIAAACGTTASCISRWESGERHASGAAGMRYAAVLSVLYAESQA